MFYVYFELVVSSGRDPNSNADISKGFLWCIVIVIVSVTTKNVFQINS